ncbi:hypothetical protein ACWEQC_10085 [Streptomyces shenzhenensis]
MRNRGGRPEGHCRRAMLDAIRYLADNASSGRRCPPISRRGTTPWSDGSMTGYALRSGSGWAAMRSPRPG